MTTQERGRRRHAHLLAAAVDLLIEGGFTALTHRAVAHRAHLPLAATTYYFTSRDHLLAQAFAHLVDTELTTLRHWTTHPPAELADHLTHHIATADRNRQLALWELYVHAGRDPALQQIARHWTDGCVRTLADALHLPATDPRARHLYTTLSALWLEHVVEQRPLHHLRTHLTTALHHATQPP